MKMKFASVLKWLSLWAIIFPTIALAQFDESMVKDTLNRYFDALRSGDTQEISALMSPKLRRQHSASLSNSQYGETLVTIYQEATFVIDQIEFDNPNQPRAWILFSIADGQPQRLRIDLTSLNDGESYSISRIDQ